MNFIRDEDAKFKDINAISDYGLFQGVVKRATDRKAKKEADKAREISPLMPANDSIEVNSSNLTPQEVKEIVLKIYKENTKED